MLSVISLRVLTAAPTFAVHSNDNPPPGSVLDTVIVSDYPTRRFNIIPSSNFTLTCATNSASNTVNWHFDYSGVPLPLSGQGYSISTSVNVSTLSFSNFTAGRNGVYRCWASRFAETVQSRAVLLNTGGFCVCVCVCVYMWCVCVRVYARV